MFSRFGEGLTELYGSLRRGRFSGGIAKCLVRTAMGHADVTRKDAHNKREIGK